MALALRYSFKGTCCCIDRVYRLGRPAPSLTKHDLNVLECERRFSAPSVPDPRSPGISKLHMGSFGKSSIFALAGMACYASMLLRFTGRRIKSIAGIVGC